MNTKKANTHTHQNKTEIMQSNGANESIKGKKKHIAVSTKDFLS